MNLVSNIVRCEYLKQKTETKRDWEGSWASIGRIAAVDGDWQRVGW